jgi:hypothetical protein
MATQIEIVNRALVLIGVEPLASLTEDSAAARVAAAIWPDAIKAGISKSRWLFARFTQTATLSQHADNSPGDNYTRWVLPSDRLMIEGLKDLRGEELVYKIEGDLAVIESYAPPTKVYCTYVKDPGTGSLPSPFVVAMSYELAAEFAGPLTENATLIGRMRDTAQDKWQDAKTQDSQQAASQALLDGDLEATMFLVR